MAGTVLKSNNAEIGLATGTTVTSANSSGGSQDGLVININAGNTLVVTSTSPLDGTYSYLLTQGGANLLEMYLALASTQSDFSWQYWFVHKTPAVNNAFYRTFTTTTFTGTAFTLFQRTDNKYHIFDTTSSTQSATSTGALVDGTAYVVQGRYNAGSVTVNIYPVGSTTASVTITMSVGTVSIGSQRIAIGTASVLTSFRVDNIAAGTGGFLARSDVSNVPPTASVGPAQYVVAGTVVSLTGTDADSDGTVTSRAWTWDTTDTSGPAGTTRKWASGPTITGATTQNATATMATAGSYRAKYVVTDDNGATSTPAYTNVFVYPAPVSGVSSPVTVRHAVKGSWTRVSGSDDTAVLNDASDSTGHQSPDDPTAQPDIFLMQPHGPGAAAGAITLTVRGNSSGGNISRAVQWFKSDGTTQLGATITQTAPTSLGDQVFTMDSTGIAAVPNLSDRAELVVKLLPTAI